MRAHALARIVPAIALFVTVAALVCAQAWPASGAGTTSSLASLQSGVLAQLNQIRHAHGLVPLRLNDALTAAAADHSAEMLADGYFAHTSADGLSFWQRIERYYPSAQTRSWGAAENLLWIAGPIDAKNVVDAWMSSPDHRANILAPRWRDVGIAAFYNSAAPGVFAGYGVTLVATDFGFRS